MNIEDIEIFSNKISGKLYFDYDLKKTNWFNIGGKSKIFFKPEKLEELIEFLKIYKNRGKIFIIGAGSNVLISDKLYDGVIIKLGRNFSKISLLNDTTIIAGSSASDKQVSEFAKENDIGGFEYLSCIPGSVGGGIRMNTGCYGEDISKILVSVQVMDLNGQMRVIYLSDIKFSYRSCNLDEKLIFISATFQGQKESKLKIKKKIDNLVDKKKKDQPSKIKTCGSTFKNPKNNKAWKLIKESGCSGLEIGDAYISDKHCNFFVNRGKAKSEDLENLINKVKEKVLEKTGVNLELELQIIGKKL